ncbi:MAG: right-handed parallel beta-helix repeat-containing protein, partial [Chloroflexota bacterium]
MVLGGTQVENAVAPEDAFQTLGTASVSLTIGGDLYFEPNFAAQVMGSVPMGITLTADAVSLDGQWVRVVYQGTPGWVTRQVIGAEADLSALAVIGPDTKTPMQAFYFRTGIGGTECVDAPTSLVIQGPQNLTVNINANGADIQLSSTIALQALPADPTTLQNLRDEYGNIGDVSQLMKIVVIDGHVVLNEGTDEEIVMETGETTFRCLSDAENLGEDGEANDREVINACPWSPPRDVTVEDLEEFRELEGLPLNYAIDLPLDLPTLTPTPSDTPRPQGAGLILTTAAPTLTPTGTDTPVPPPGEPPTQPPAGSPTDTPTPTDTPSDTATPTSTPTATADPCAADTYTFPASITGGDSLGLIAAIDHANDELCHPGLNQIILETGAAYNFDTVNNATNGPNAVPVISSPILITGQGARLNVEVGGASPELRAFYINGSGNLTVNSLTISGGSLTSAGGGAILNDGTLSLQFSTLSGNRSTGNGGQLYNNGTVNIDSTTFQNGMGVNGAGLYNGGGTVNISRSTFQNNSASDSGGGIFVNAGSVSLLNSTLSGNNGTFGGGGLYVIGGSAALNFTTVYGNAGGPSAPGGGVLNAGATLLVSNSIVAQNTTTNCDGIVSLSGVNFDDDGSCTGSPSSLNIDSSLQNNGGSTNTHAQFAGSAAIDQAACGGLSEDQRGFSRPVDGNGSPDANECDAGSFEYIPPGP